MTRYLGLERTHQEQSPFRAMEAQRNAPESLRQSTGLRPGQGGPGAPPGCSRAAASPGEKKVVQITLVCASLLPVISNHLRGRCRPMDWMLPEGPSPQDRAPGVALGPQGAGGQL